MLLACSLETNSCFLPPSPLQAGHRTAAGLHHPGYRHQPAERVPAVVQRTSGQPGPGPSAGLSQTLYTAGTCPFQCQPTDGLGLPKMQMCKMCPRLSLPSDCSEVR